MTNNHHQEYLPIMTTGFQRWQLPPIYWPRRPAQDFTFTSSWFLHYLHLFWCFIHVFLVFDISYTILYIIFCTISNVLCRGLVIFIYVRLLSCVFFFIFRVHGIWCYWLLNWSLLPSGVFLRWPRQIQIQKLNTYQI